MMADDKGIAPKGEWDLPVEEAVRTYSLYTLGVEI